MGFESSTPAQPESSKSECSSMIDFYEYFDYPYGDFRTVDRSNVTVCCDMDGVTCAQDKVISLKLDAKDLQGSIPQVINELKSLKSLDLSGNQLTGPIPDLQLEALETLNLQNNKLNGNIPLSLNNLTSAAVVDLSGNQLSGEIPPLELVKLKVLKLQNNQLTGQIPQSFNSLSNLEDLEINGNNLAGDLTCSLLNTTLTTINVDGNEELVGKVWLNASSESTLGYVPGTKVFLCDNSGSVAFCQSKPNCLFTYRRSEKDGSGLRFTSVSSSSSKSSLLSTDSNSVVIASVAGVGLVGLIGLLGYLIWKHRQSKFQQFDPEIRSDKKDKVHRLSLFLSKKTKNPSQMESVS